MSRIQGNREGARMRAFRVLGAVIAASIMMGSAYAAEFRPFSHEAFAQAQAAGRPILIEAHADWCPTCRAQAPVVRRAAAAPEFADLVVFTLDFDAQTAERRALGIRAQSTLIMFDGRTETARSVGDTDQGRISALLRTAIR